ncbi:electron transfer flavoprotein subunit alpha/FixB family protein [Photobacterium alginatilyticum]|uniref:Electron transfer flavoprotein subunit alpha/FixB family protein n=1 Tax=Photobacterium alginatilyticum TaxID=1775171 RepID=A0ABW9YFX5_9GAMM|nr:FAD-binding protein [Photobacterium alginatilyticum]NBI52069.1 electron transfer flavoprotein subunit alpha/FixB family protein [Photobacterium alginatilyticum]
MATLIIAEHNNLSLSPDTQKAINAAMALSPSVSVLVAGDNCRSVADEASKIAGVEQVLLANNTVYEHQLAENLSALIAEVAAQQYTHILAPSTTFGKNLMPRVAALLDVGQLSDVIQIKSEDTVVRPIYAGNALAEVRSNDPIKVITIRSAAFDLAEIQPEQSAPVSELDIVIANDMAKFVSRQAVESERPELAAARVVVSGGRGLGNSESFALVEKLADKLGGAIGASRAAVDAGFVSNDLQVGQTGKIVAPELYIAVGISGAIQHLAGMKDSKVIVAINNDPDAPIFQIADYGLVGDLFELLPELIESL